ncbi:hypothetical protein [Embleya sp. NBC_00896]|uniref:hypothetical protein n=1 Tax=Embleya sp. NBC_00896 TaxID=2975961 RepID=UPI00386EA010|nr:hypothetical protein OG928_32015 [Embleya sp. NBC_00896]
MEREPVGVMGLSELPARQHPPTGPADADRVPDRVPVARRRVGHLSTAVAVRAGARACGLQAGILYAVGRDQRDIESIGGRLVTQLVDTGDNAGSKRAKAQALNIEIIAPEEFATLIESVPNDDASS